MELISKEPICTDRTSKTGQGNTGSYFLSRKQKKRKERNPVPEIRTRNDKTDGI
jgi:hypothetical protein